MRKRRNLSNGKWYVSTKSMEFAARQSEYMKTINTSERMKEVREYANTPEAKAKFRASKKRFFRLNPDHQSEIVRKSYRDHPELAQKRADRLEQTANQHPEVKNHYTDPENARIRSTTRDGKVVIRIVTGVRNKSTGVIVNV